MTTEQKPLTTKRFGKTREMPIVAFKELFSDYEIRSGKSGSSTKHDEGIFLGGNYIDGQFMVVFGTPTEKAQEEISAICCDGNWSSYQFYQWKTGIAGVFGDRMMIAGGPEHTIVDLPEELEPFINCR